MAVIRAFFEAESGIRSITAILYRRSASSVMPFPGHVEDHHDPRLADVFWIR